MLIACLRGFKMNTRKSRNDVIISAVVNVGEEKRKDEEKGEEERRGEGMGGACCRGGTLGFQY